MIMLQGILCASLPNIQDIARYANEGRAEHFVESLYRVFDSPGPDLDN